MRVISKDGCINVPYEGHMFCIIIDDESKIYSVAVRTPNFTGFMSLGDYDTFDEAKAAFEKLIEAGNNLGEFTFRFE